MDALRDVSDAALVPEMLAHVRASFPEATVNQDEQSLTASVTAAIKKARVYSLFSNQDTCKFINLTMVFGSDWENSQDRRWIHDALTDSSGGTPSERLDCVYRKGLFQLEAGTDGGA
jgi:hypothetical protein